MKRLGLIVVALLIGGAAQRAEAGNSGTLVVHSSYVTMRDGTRLAVDIWLSDQLAPGARVPIIAEFTRYWRASLQTPDKVPPAVRYFTAAGYAVAIADMRGTGASFGSRSTEFSDAELKDYGEIIDWLAAQPWSNGRVATLGTSYLGNTAELAAIPARPALKAVVPRFSDFSEYRNAVRPGGVLNAVIAKAWVAATAALDRNDACGLFEPVHDCQGKDRWAVGVKPVDGNDGLLKQAVGEHAGNTILAPIVDRLVYSDDPFTGPGRSKVTLDYVSPSNRWPAIDDAHVPAFHWASWFDGGTAEGVLTRYMTYKTPINVVIGAWNHGGNSNANPYQGVQGEGPPDPPVPDQFTQIRQFLDPLLKPSLHERPVPMGRVQYYTIGQNRWHTTTSWPPKNTQTERWYFSGDHSLTRSSPKARNSADRYRVDFTATTGTHNRWHTQLGTYVRYADRRAEDKKLLTYTSLPLTRDMNITGTPVAHVEMASTTTDGALFIYLEDVAPDGTVTYLADGQIRLIFNGKVHDTVSYRYTGPMHTFARSEARPFPKSRSGLLEFSFSPISVLLRAGHRLRIALAGADAGTFERLPAGHAVPVYSIQRSAARASFVTLPVERQP